MKMSLNCFYKLCKQLTNKILIKEVKVPGGIAFTFQIIALSCMQFSSLGRVKPSYPTMIIGVGVLNKYLHVFHQRLNPEPRRPQGSPNSPSICSLSHPPSKRPAPEFCSTHHPACPAALSWLSSCSAALLTHSHLITTQNLTVSLSFPHSQVFHYTNKFGHIGVFSPPVFTSAPCQMQLSCVYF